MKKGRVILITGASGFVGKNFTQYLRASNLENQIVLLTSKEVEGFCCINHKQYTFTENDFRSKGIDKIDVLVHLGAYSPKTNHQADDWQNNYSSIANLVYLLKHLPCVPEKIVYGSSITVYGKPVGRITEESLCNPNSIYGLTKLYCEKIIWQFGIEHKIPVNILRFGNIYGPGEEGYSYLIPIVFKKIIALERPIIYTAGEEKRSYIYINDVCRLLADAVNRLNENQIINVVSENAVSVKEIVEQMLQISFSKLDAEIVGNIVDTYDEIYDNTKMKRMLGVEEWSLEDGLKQEFDWIKNS